MVLRFSKSLHGLEQSSYIWYATIKNFGIWIRLIASHVNGGLFVIEDLGTVVAVVILYLDDPLIIANKGLIGQNKDQRNKRFRMHDLWIVSIYIGWNVECNQEHHTIDVQQHSNIRMILAKFTMDQSRPDPKRMGIKLDKRKHYEDACNPTI